MEKYLFGAMFGFLIGFYTADFMRKAIETDLSVFQLGYSFGALAESKSWVQNKQGDTAYFNSLQRNDEQEFIKLNK